MCKCTAHLASQTCAPHIWHVCCITHQDYCCYPLVDLVMTRDYHHLWKYCAQAPAEASACSQILAKLAAGVQKPCLSSICLVFQEQSFASFHSGVITIYDYPQVCACALPRPNWANDLLADPGQVGFRHAQALSADCSASSCSARALARPAHFKASPAWWQVRGRAHGRFQHQDCW